MSILSYENISKYRRSRETLGLWTVETQRSRQVVQKKFLPEYKGDYQGSKNKATNYCKDHDETHIERW